jgi:trehalose 6-phosphate synthase
VLFVNPILDGMNLVAKEGPIVNQKRGALVLSRTAGAYQQLKEAIIPISPIDISGMAESMYKALTLSQKERNKKWELARKLVKKYDLNMWFNNQIHDISELLNEKIRNRR